MIEVYIEKLTVNYTEALRGDAPIYEQEIWIVTDEGMAFVAMDECIFSWPKGPWGPAGCIDMKDITDQKIYKEVKDNLIDNK